MFEIRKAKDLRSPHDCGQVISCNSQIETTISHWTAFKTSTKKTNPIYSIIKALISRDKAFGKV